RAGLDETAGLDDDLASLDHSPLVTSPAVPDSTARPAREVGQDGTARPARPPQSAGADDAAEPDDAEAAEEKEHQHGRAPAAGVGWPDRLIPSGQKANGTGHAGTPASRS